MKGESQHAESASKIKSENVPEMQRGIYRKIPKIIGGQKRGS